MSEKTVTIKIQRQDSQSSQPYWQTFVIPRKPNANIISCLMDIRKKPVTTEGQQVTPVVWDCNCLEEVCGACTMVINGKVRQSCSTLVDKLEEPITLQPMSKFPVVRDLMVDRSRMFEALKRVKAWINVDGFHDLGTGPKIPEKQQQVAYKLSECMTCGCCVEACPQFTKGGDFIGAAAISQARLFNMNPTGEYNADERLDALMQKGGVADCGKAKNCVEVCPKSIPLTESIAEMGRQTSRRFWKSLIRI
ncbi:MAG: succinate dehydrogenase iron-sulfur subunit [SAR324 cluster bacterium]|nr:succinate dehydrogenase iron-sulfur subunit [SAR324 cluster bacterium]MBF0351957.1 succinate dehydrogenase iron-sulfur subunit [SAR324 cluster bacterium]